MSHSKCCQYTNPLKPCNFLFFCLLTEEAEAKYGADQIKIYKSSFTGMYHAVTTRKTMTHMKLVCVLPEEKVCHFISPLKQLKIFKDRSMQMIDHSLAVSGIIPASWEPLSSGSISM